ncbi:hypothetical protein INT47_013195 [Mucor saturninus]|uniref:Reverse transcriptase domain-containing protein n=1 Tax=Mucor saturninus TaxID=64648 RepID=A0A8H7QHR4_9FUNG|nr:hypothetical protein INT47_013195 [Mucor saturninus]
MLTTNNPHISNDSVPESFSTPTTCSPPPSKGPNILKIGTLNCRGLRKTAEPATSNQFIRYLRTQSFDLLALQETHASTTDIGNLFHTQFQAISSYWSHYCGIVCFSPTLRLSEPSWDHTQRCLTVTVSHLDDLFDPVSVTVIYAPADYRSRQAFLLPSQLNLPDSPSRSILLGDFNYSYTTTISPNNFLTAPASWLQYLKDNFQDSVLVTNQFHQPTFHRGSSSSCIDYIFLSNDITMSCLAPSYSFIQPVWSDHMLLSITLDLPPMSRDDDTVPSTPNVGKGIWRAHPRLAASKRFRRQLAQTLTDSLTSFPSNLDVQTKWDELKRITKSVCRKFSSKQAYSLSTVEKILQKKRSGLTTQILRDPTSQAALSPLLKIVEHQLASIQQHHTDTLALRSGLHWREQGEVSAGYLKRTISQRQSKTIFRSILHPGTSVLHSDLPGMLDAAKTFYSELYSPDPIAPAALDEMLQSLPDTLTLPESDQYLLARSIDWDELCDGVSRCPKQSSPGIDGLPYEILKLLFYHSGCRDILLQVYNDALHHGKFPSSWLQTCVSLLPKKGDLTDLKNWRPISLINTDAKVFTRILTNRIVNCVDSIITPFQSGFLHGRFIADNGLLMKLLMAHARSSDSSAICLLLDQEKAYDRVHPEYLRRVMLHFGFPIGITSCISRLFFSTSLQLNINGHLTESIPQLRGLRQGDPLSPVLFNLAFEPFLRRVLHDPLFTGFSLPPSLSVPASIDHQVKLLAYADDVACFLQSPEDLHRLNQHLHTYSAASNARINFHKTESFALSGRNSIYHSVWRTPLVQSRIEKWHDSTALAPILYLGYPIFHSPNQRNVYQDLLLSKIKSACDIHSHRSLSFRGRVTIANNLILSKLWYVLRVVSVTKKFLNDVISVISGFVSRRCFPRISFDTMTLPRSSGGLGLLNPFVQQSSLQFRWIVPLVALSSLDSEFWSSSDFSRSFVLPLLADYLIMLLESSSNLTVNNSCGI